MPGLRRIFLNFLFRVFYHPGHGAEQNCGQEPVLVNCMKIMRIIRSSLNLCGTAFLRRYSCSGSAPGFRPQR